MLAHVYKFTGSFQSLANIFGVKVLFELLYINNQTIYLGTYFYFNM